MNRFLVIRVLTLVLALSASAQAQINTSPRIPGYEIVPDNSWSYEVIEKLIPSVYFNLDCGCPKIYHELGIGNNRTIQVKGWTRYEFAVALARIHDKIAASAGKQESMQAEERDALAALSIEFSEELKRLHQRNGGVEPRVTNSINTR